jgi:cell division protein FtsN
MVATVKHNKRTSTTKRNTASQNMRSGKFYFLCSIVVILIVFFSYILYQLKAIKVPKNTTDKQSQIVSKPKYKQIENSYNYTEILESKEIDSGSGVKITRNYEAEKIAKENAYRKELEEKKKAKQKAEQEKIALAEERKRQAFEKKLQTDQQRLVSAKESNTLKQNKIEAYQKKPTNVADKYINCSSDNYRTIKEAESQKAKLAFSGKESKVVYKQMGGGVVYSVNIGPYNTLNEAVSARNELLNSKLGKNCSIQ